MSQQGELGGTFTFKGISRTVNRIGYGCISLAGPMAYGAPQDRKAVADVLKEAINLGINHFDTSDYYGPHVANQIIKETLFPYGKNLVIATKVGSKRTPDKGWPKALSENELTSAIEDNLQNLGLNVLEIVNLRVGEPQGTNEASIAEPLKVLQKLKEQGLIRGIGLSNISLKQYQEARDISEIVCVQNFYNLAMRKDDAMIDRLNADGVAFVPFFPLGGFKPIQSDQLNKVAASLEVSPQQVALAWLLQRSSNILCISGTSSIEHLRENCAAGKLKLSHEAIQDLNQIGKH